MNPLQIFEKHPEADAYRVGHAFTPYAILATEKRFTDAELAAEYWMSVACDMPSAEVVTLMRFRRQSHFDA